MSFEGLGSFKAREVREVVEISPWDRRLQAALARIRRFWQIKYMAIADSPLHVSAIPHVEERCSKAEALVKQVKSAHRAKDEAAMLAAEAAILQYGTC